jgi:Tfp pilus assembly protein PilX
MMNKQQNNNLTLIQFMLRAQQIARQDGRSDQGYAMVVVSIVTLLLFSLIGMYLTLTNMSKASTSAYVDGTNTFYTAESGLNRRAEVLRQKFIGYSLPTGLSPGQTAANTFVPPTNVANCFALTPTTSATVRGSGDFSCQNFAYGHTDNSSATVRRLADGKVETTNLGKATNYNAYTFVTDVTNYAPGTVPLAPNPIVIPPGRQYAGLNAMEYRYTVYSTAAKQNNAGTPIDQADARTVLQMNFTSRIVPLFQFAVFYDGDLEMNSSSDMTIGGRVHTNANFYVQPNTANAAIRTTFLSPITAVGSIYNRLDSTGTTWHFPSTRMLMTGIDCATGTCLDFPTYNAAVTVPLTQPQLNAFGNRVQSGTFNQQIRRLDTPPPGFLRKRNYFESSTRANAGEYYAKADMRLEMVPDRDVTSTAAIPWTRDTRRIPFNFTSITTSASASTCSTTLPPTDASTTGVPTLTSDPAADYVDPERNNITALRCRKFTKGQLQSLRQPVMVLTNINQPNVGLRTTPGTVPTVTSERALLLNPRAGVAPAALPVAVIPGLTTTVTGNPATQQKILRALQVAIVSNPTPVDLGTLNTPINSASLTTVRNTFRQLLGDLGITGIISAAEVNVLSDVTATVTPNQIAALQGAWFLPAPIQRVEKTNTDAALNAAPTGAAPGFAADVNNRNFRSSGFHDGRERRWITMLQTNIASLSVWNRDGLYVEANDDTTDLLRTQPYVTNTALRQAAFNSGAGANFTDGFAFDRATATMIAAATPAVIPQGLQTLGLGSIENTEGGLVFHATVSDDLNGDGVMNTSDVSLDIANPIMKTDAVGNLVGSNNLPVAPGNAAVTIDFPRKYRGSANFKSPFGFAFNGGNYLPGALTLVTDQAIYTQGDFNNNGAAQPNTNNAATIAANPPSLTRLPASIIGDTITILSNQCLNTAATSTATATSTTGSNNNHLGVPVGQIKCGLPSISNGSVNVTVSGFRAGNWYQVDGPTAVNAAFLSNIDRSRGNLGAGRGFGGATTRFSGAINNYIRMVEGWGTGGQQFNYTGSFVSLGTPLEYSGAYAGTDTDGSFINNSYYQIPSRNFKFDTKFNTFNLLPPLPPRAIYLEQDVFKRNFN